MKQEIILEEIKKFLDHSAPDSFPKNGSQAHSPYPDILPVILHKLKNKLTPILGYSQILQMKNSDEKLGEKISRIERNAVELTELFDNLKDSLILGKTPLATRSMNELIMEEPELFRSVRENGIRLKADLSKNLPLLPLNPRLFSLLLQNVIRNSITGILSTGKGDGEIRLTTREEGENIVLTVRDNGCGIEPSDMENIWTPFFSRFPEKGGIGLLTAEKVMEEHGGTYSAESQPGTFTEFIFRFPRKGEPKTSVPDRKINVVLIGFSRDEAEVLEEISSENESIHIRTAELGGFNPGQGVKGDTLVICSSGITGSEKQMEAVSNIFPDIDGELILFYSGEFPKNLFDIFTEENVKIFPDRTKLLTTINILATAINKEE